MEQLYRAKVLHDQGKAAEAEACLRDAIVLDPANSEVHRFLGNILREELGRCDEAIACFERALAVSPSSVATYYDLVRTKRLTEADHALIPQMLSLLNGSG